MQVSTFEQLDAALRKTPLQPIIVMNDIGLDKMLPNISGSVVISGNPATCAKSEVSRPQRAPRCAFVGLTLQESLGVIWTLRFWPLKDRFDVVLILTTGD